MTDDAGGPDGYDEDYEPWVDDYDFGALDRAITAIAASLDSVGDAGSAGLVRDSMRRLREIPNRYPDMEGDTAQLHLALEDMWKHAKWLWDFIAEHFAPPDQI
jgi:hypothetical protein